MPSPSLSIVIPTHNRPQLLLRTLASIFVQTIIPVEIIIVDDASTMDVQKILPKANNLHYLRLGQSFGPCVARNTGIAKTTSDWILCLDDDDELMPMALATITAVIARHTGLTAYPAIMFTTNITVCKNPAPVLSLKDFINGNIIGDTLNVIQRSVFINEKLAYPNLKIGGESLLWWQIAKQWGIPFFPTRLMKVNSDASQQLTSATNQIRNAAQHADFQALRIQTFYADLIHHPQAFIGRHLAAATYFMLCQNNSKARQFIKPILQKNVPALLLYLLSFFPSRWSKPLFLIYRHSMMKTLAFLKR